MIKTNRIFNANVLKMIGLLTMICDHVGFWLFPRVEMLRIIGRIAFPIYAYMLAEGAIHTKSIVKYFLRVFTLGVICQIAVYVGSGTMALEVLITLSISLALIALYRVAQSVSARGGRISCAVLFVFLLALSAFLSYPPVSLVYKIRLSLDYGLFGVLLPFVLSLCPSKRTKIPVLVIMLCAIAFEYSKIQFYSLLAVPLLALYNGERGKLNLKSFFYLSYPVHLIIILAIFYFCR